MPTCAGLKVKAKWLRLMRGKRVRGAPLRKTAEVRRYRPWERTPRGQRPVEVGERLFLLCGGEVWGSARLADVTEYGDMAAFRAAEAEHCVTQDTCRGPEVQDIVQALERGRHVYGWQLADFRWFEPARRPRSGTDGVPEFKGQGHGWVWSDQRLPTALEDAAAAGAPAP